ncbi:NmrA-like family domain-containing oxidoreductase phqG [Pseudocercospora fuligena]|uniref:NmrA-like family domain-containing oxidoreductase phqG n=1 Tax=Pseudocercospora fuligena TaxID=685502 RepID=A0A8H6VJ53_9PEZI|nr:NmrA-like family domain-containing oxidoreductase phqG [Pseudocercospora fuligena]
MTTAMPTLRPLVVTGATGKQGGALISALLSKPTQPFEIYAVTRNKTSKSAQALASKPNVHLIEGSFTDPAAIFSQEGKALVNAAIAAGVEHIVFTATDRGVNSDNDPTIVPHFASKYNIEQEISAKSKGKGTWTFLRPVAFYENMTNDFLGKAFISMWRLNGNDRKLQLVSTKDIGKIAAEAFLNAESPEYKNTSISLAGDEISVVEAEKVFREVTGGQQIPETYGFVARILKWVLHEHLGIMFNWFATDGFGTDVPGLRKRYPYLKDFRAWLETESAWKK